MGSYFSGGNAIKIEINSASPYLSIWGTIQASSEEEIIVEIEGVYAQWEIKKAKCTVSVATKIYVFETLIKEANNNRIVLLTPDEDKVSVMQRREFLRVATDIPVSCFLINNENAKLAGEKFFPAIVKDISGGGVLLNSFISLPLGTTLVFELEIDNSPMVLTVRIVRNKENHNNSSRDMGCEFIGLDESDRQKIISYCTRLQVKRKKKKVAN